MKVPYAMRSPKLMSSRQTTSALLPLCPHKQQFAGKAGANIFFNCTRSPTNKQRVSAVWVMASGTILCKALGPAATALRLPSWQRTPRRVVCCSAASSCRTEGQTRLPNNTLWLDWEPANHDVLYGSNFVVQRPRTGGPGLVLDKRISSIQVLGSEKSNLALQQTAQSPGKLAVGPGDMFAEVVITDYTFIENFTDNELLQLPSPPLQTSASLGIVLHSSSAGCAEVPDPEDPDNTTHKRRTARVRFTCNLCETENVKAINPHAWNKGSVFARCKGCDVIHKLTDNLKLFHELAGPVFPGGLRPRKMKFPPSLALCPLPLDLRLKDL